MGSHNAEDFHDDPVGPFTGFGNFFAKELRDWWKSRRFLLVCAIVTLVICASGLFAFASHKNMARRAQQMGHPNVNDETIATVLLLELYRTPVLFTFIMIFSTMGLLASEKSTGTLAWNLTKPLGRTGLFVAKWLAATLLLWLAMCVLPMVAGIGCMIGYHGVTPDVSKITPVVVIALAWIGWWVLLMLTISLGFSSMAAVGGVGIAFWVIPNVFGLLLEQVFGKEIRDWILDLLASNSPFWGYRITVDQHLEFLRSGPVKQAWYWAFGVWTILLWVVSLRIFSRQEVGS